MFASGDLDMLQPLFNMYCGLIDFNVKRTRKYLGMTEETRVYIADRLEARVTGLPKWVERRRGRFVILGAKGIL